MPRRLGPVIHHPDDGKVIYSFRYRDQIGKLWRISFIVQFTKINDLLVRLFHYKDHRVQLLGGGLVATLTPINEKKERADAAAAADGSLDRADHDRAEGAAPENRAVGGATLVRYSIDDE